jgi:hypothetical protein
MPARSNKTLRTVLSRLWSNPVVSQVLHTKNKTSDLKQEIQILILIQIILFEMTVVWAGL